MDLVVYTRWTILALGNRHRHGMIRAGCVSLFSGDCMRKEIYWYLYILGRTNNDYDSSQLQLLVTPSDCCGC